MSIYIAFGANEGRPSAAFGKASARLSARGVKIMDMSGLWQSPAWPRGSGQPDYVNSCARVEFGGASETLLAILHQTEAEFGRIRTTKNAPRPMDLDLLDFKGQQHATITITLPHPRLMERGFVLLPLSQVAPHWSHPATGESIGLAIAKLPLADIAPMRYLGKI
jgi:2-amino-4-hydroxy-6-hydroxymethyldihydropteridine diphosphokinase